MSTERVDRRQFVIGSRPYSGKIGNWTSIKINNKMYLSYERSLPLIEDYDSNGTAFYIMGIAVQTHPEKKEPKDEVKYGHERIEEIYSSWAGRWVFFTSTELHMDFSGLLGCYYAFIDGELWVSSSVRILSDLIGRNYEQDPLSNSRMNWYPPPVSANPLVKALLPSQIINLQEGKIKARQLFPSSKMQYSESEALDILEHSLLIGMKAVATKYNVWIPLSAGYDSRLLLAAAARSGIHTKTYTNRKTNRWPWFSRKFPSTSLVSHADMSLPPLIARACGFEHQWIPEKEVEWEKLWEFDSHTAKGILENDRVYYARGQWDWPQDNDAILLGQVMEIGTCFFHSLFKTPGVLPQIDEVVDFYNLKHHRHQEKGILEYIDWVNEYLKLFPEDIDWRDRFYLEQRLRGWLSPLQQGLDLVLGERIHLYNSQMFICALLCLPEKKRRRKNFVKELIDRMAPELNNIPYNPPDPFCYGLKKKIIKAMKMSPREYWSIIHRKMKR